MNRPRHRTTRPPSVQELESRRLLAAFDTPWPEARDLAVSFPADGVQVGDAQNELHQLLDQLAERPVWQELALRAYQTWAWHADVNVGLRNDYNNDFGAPGLIVGDPRFGEFRIGAIAQQGLVASSVPFQAVAGTHSGDLLLDASESFLVHDWADQQPPAALAAGERDLFSILLHEAGNTLGLDDNLETSSVMFRQYTVPKGVLSEQDIAAIEALYGARSDPYESVANETVQAASILETPVGFAPSQEVLRTRGSLAAASDVDVYKITPLAGQDEVTIRLRGRGVSLLQSRLEVVDAAGLPIASDESVSVFENDSSLTITGLHAHPELYLRVSPRDPGDIYSVGDYWLEVDYRDREVQATDPQPGAYDSGPEAVFVGFDLSDPEWGVNDSVALAETVSPLLASGVPRYEWTSAVSASDGVDFFKITAPAAGSGRLIARVAGVGLNQPEVRLRVVDAEGQSVGTAAKLHSDGTFSVEVAAPAGGEDYFLRISVDPSSQVGVGNYVVTAGFGVPAEQMNHVVSGQVDGELDKFIRWTAAKTKLFRFDLTADSSEPQQAVQLTVYDAHTRTVKMVAVARGGMTRSVLGWLQQGEYMLRLTALSLGDAPVATSDFTIHADGLSDDQDEDPYDPGDDPTYDPYNYSYEPDPYDYQYDPGEPYYDPYYDDPYYYQV